MWHFLKGQARLDENLSHQLQNGSFECVQGYPEVDFDMRHCLDDLTILEMEEAVCLFIILFWLADRIHKLPRAHLTLLQMLQPKQNPLQPFAAFIHNWTSRPESFLV